MKHSGKEILNRILTLVIVISLISAGFLGYKMIRKQMEYREGQKRLQEIYEMMESQEDSGEGLSEGAEKESLDAEAAKQERLAQYGKLHEENDDMVGWIQIEGTQVDYPVMYTPEDPTYYQYRNFQKEKNSYGAIFVDGDCRMDGTSPNLVIYGHHMRNGAMFAEIEDYDSKDFMEEHPLIQFDTLEELQTYQVAAAFKRPAGELDEEFKKMLLAETEEQFEQFVKYVKQHQFYDSGIDLAWGDELITLTTCEYTQGDGRFFVIAKRVEK